MKTWLSHQRQKQSKKQQISADISRSLLFWFHVLILCFCLPLLNLSVAFVTYQGSKINVRFCLFGYFGLFSLSSSFSLFSISIELSWFLSNMFQLPRPNMQNNNVEWCQGIQVQWENSSGKKCQQKRDIRDIRCKKRANNNAKVMNHQPTIQLLNRNRYLQAY